MERDQTERDGSTDIEATERHPQGREALRRLRWTHVAVTVLLATALSLGALALAASAGTGGVRSQGEARLLSSGGSGVAPGATITVTGSGTVEGTPDTVSFQIGVHTSAASATEALAGNDARMAALEASLARAGVREKDMQTSNLSISESQSRSGVVTGFSVDDELDVTMHGVAAAGRAIDAATKAAGNGIEVYGVTFSISNQSGLLAAARARAVQSARTQAEQVAAGAGLVLGGVVSMTDQENSSQPVTYAPFAPMAGVASVPLRAGSQPVSVQVRVVYLLAS